MWGLFQQEVEKSKKERKVTLWKCWGCAFELQHAHSVWSVRTGPIMRPNACHSTRPTVCQTVLERLPVRTDDGAETPAGTLILVRLSTCQQKRVGKTKARLLSGRLGNLCFAVSRWVKRIVWIPEQNDISWKFPTCASAPFIAQTYKKNYIEMNLSNLSLLKSHINPNILTSCQSFGITETAERHEPTELNSLGRHATESWGQQCFS